MIKTTAVIHEKYGIPLFLDEITINDPKPDEVVVKMFASGICSSQLINLNNERLQSPELLGHEGTGVVVEVGKSVEHVKEGDHVLISWMPYNADRNTEYLQWGNIQWKGQDVKTLIFTWAEHAVMHKQFVSKMDKDIDKYKTSIIGCAGIAGYGTVMNTVKVKKGNSVAVFGVGGLGVLALNASKNCGADPIIAIDIDDRKLEFAKSFGATHFINSNKVDPVQKIGEISAGGVDYVFDMVGTGKIRETTILASKEGVPGYCEGGTTVLVGFPDGSAEFNPRHILMGQRNYKGSRGGACVPSRDFPIFFQDYQEGKLLLDKAVSRHYKLDQINEAIEQMRNGNILGRVIIEIS